MITSFIVKNDLELSVILDPPFWIFEMYSILLKHVEIEVIVIEKSKDKIRTLWNSERN